MTRVFEGWLFDPAAGKITLLAVGLVAIAVLARLLKSAASRYFSDDATRYQVR